MISALIRITNRKSFIRYVILACLGLGFSVPVAAQEAESVEAPYSFEPVITARGTFQAAQDVPVTMRDGIAIALDIYRPDDDQPHPTLYAAGPYPHQPGILNDETSPVGPVAWYVSRGYAVVIASVRGTGLSGGDFSFFSRDEQQDHYEIIEWIAAQSWSDGQVAGTGAGYYATSQWQMAIQGPPHLECIAPINGMLDPFREVVYPGGLTNNAFINNWFDRDVRLANAFAPGASRLISMDMRLTQLSHPWYDEYWQVRSSLENVDLINVPVFTINDWNVEGSEFTLSDTFTALNRLNTVNKILLGNPEPDTPLYQNIPFLDRELMPYYEWCFTGKTPTSRFIEAPRIRYQARGQTLIKPESNWPPGNIAQQAWLLQNSSAGSPLSGNLAMQATPGNFNSSVLNTADETPQLRFTSGYLANDLEIAGPVMLELYVAGTSGDMAFEATLKEETVEQTRIDKSPLPLFLLPEGEEQEQVTETSTFVTISRGALKASARTRDEIRSTRFSPVYAQTGPAITRPGQIYQLDIALDQAAWRFSAGKRLVLEVKPVNDGSLPTTPARITVYHNSQYPSRLWLPAVQQLTTSRPAPVTAEETADENQGLFVPL